MLTHILVVFAEHTLSAGHQPKVNRMKVVSTGSGLVVPRGNTAARLWQSTAELVADESMQIEVSGQNHDFVAPTSLVSTGSSNADSDILRRGLQRVHAELNTAAAANSAHWR